MSVHGSDAKRRFITGTNIEAKDPTCENSELVVK
jgi:hypothetical protein